MRSRELDHEERIAFRTEGRAFIGRTGVHRECCCVRDVERADVDGHPIATGSSCGILELGTGRTDDEDRSPRLGGDAIKETNELRIGPMEVVDPDDDRAIGSERAEITSPRARERFETLGRTEADESRIDENA